MKGFALTVVMEEINQLRLDYRKEEIREIFLAFMPFKIVMKAVPITRYCYERGRVGRDLILGGDFGPARKYLRSRSYSRVMEVIKKVAEDRLWRERNKKVTNDRCQR